jgi:RNA polymerase sigma factor (sigma-70 family)
MEQTAVREIGPPIVGPSHHLAFEAFYETHHRELFRALWLATRNRHEAEELMQDAFFRVYERWDRIDEVANPGGYLYRTAMNALASRRRRAAVALRKAVHLLPADTSISEIESRDAVIRALAPLSTRQRAAIVLTDLLGFTSEEAGEALGIKAVTVRVLAGRAREALRKEMGSDD